jgi:hypothetical protein
MFDFFVFYSNDWSYHDDSAFASGALSCAQTAQDKKGLET